MTPRSATVALIGIMLFAASLRIFAFTVSAPVDDAFITFRYAENLASGNGFAYNPGERVLGTTTPLYTLVLVPASVLGLSLETTSKALAVAADILICFLLYHMIRPRWGKPTGLVAAFFYGASYTGVVACGSGMETQLFLLFVTGGLWAAVSNRAAAASAFAGSAALTRPEGFLLAAILGLFLLVRVGQGKIVFPWKSVVFFLIVIAAWFGFAAIYFGSPIPNSVLAKLAQRDISTSQWLDFFVIRNPFVTLLWLGALAGTAAGIKQRCPATILLGVWATVYTLFFLVSRPPFFGSWYFPPAALPLIVLTGIFMSIVSGWILRRRSLGALAAVLLLVLADAYILPRALDSARWVRQIAETVYRPLGSYVGSITEPDDRVHASDIGYLGYFSKRYILDAAALVSPEVWRHYSQNRDDPDWDLNLVLEKRPEVVVLPIIGDLHPRFMASDFSRRYEAVRRFQVEGETDVHPPPDAADRYEDDPRFMADFIVFKKR